MNLNNLYNLAEKEKIKVYDWHIENAYGAFINVDKINAIVLNYDEIGTYIEEKETLAEELGHYYYDATYPLYCEDKQLISRQEYRAHKWKCTALVTKEALKKAKEKGLNTAYEIAEELCVREETVKYAYEFYEENGISFTNEEMLEEGI